MNPPTMDLPAPQQKAPAARFLAGLARFFGLLASFHIGIVCLLLLILLTFIGTIEQGEFGLHATQKKIFDSLYFGQEFGPLTVYLPGVYLILLVLFVNMTVGGLIRIRKKPQTIGVIIAHLSMVSLIGAGAVSYHFKTEGMMHLLKGGSSRLYHGGESWQLEIRDVANLSADIWVIRDKYFNDCTGDKTRIVNVPGLPFSVKFSNFMRNSSVVPEGDPSLAAGQSRIIDGYALQERRVVILDERSNLSAVTVDFLKPDGSALNAAHFQGFQPHPLLSPRPPFLWTVDNKTYAVELVRLKYEAPFRVRCEKVERELFPGTSKPKEYRSTVSRISATNPNGAEEKGQEHVISMNKPLRDEGLVFFQVGMNNTNPDNPESELYTTFSVVNNPSDQWPKYCCAIAALGLLIHFTMKIWSFMQRTTSASRKKEESIPLKKFISACWHY